VEAAGEEPTFSPAQALNTRLHTHSSQSTVRLPSSVVEFGDEILGHQINKRLESFAQCHSQFILLADFKENRTYSYLVLKILTKKTRIYS
jgi:hypothetical protein